MAHDSKVILGTGVPFTQWKTALQAKLVKKNILGHVFHDIPGIKPVTMPIDPSTISGTVRTGSTGSGSAQFLLELEQWILGEILAKSVIVTRLSPTICPPAYGHLTAKQLFDAVAGTRFQTLAATYTASLESLLLVKFVTSADDYINRFLAAFQSVKNAADVIESNQAMENHEGYQIGVGQATALFIRGTKEVEWLSPWRDTKAYESNDKCVSLESLISSLRTVVGNRLQLNSTCAASIPKGASLDPNANCKKCRHRHKNRFCFRQHPELAPEKVDGCEVSNKKRKIMAISTSEVDIDSDADKVATTSHTMKAPTTYRIGVSD